jgi:hypothetical protein
MFHSVAVGAGVAVGVFSVACFVAVFLEGSFFTGPLLTAIAGAVLTATLFTAAFFRGRVVLLAAALAFAALAALALLRFATSFAFAAAESFRFGFGASGVTGADTPFTAAHRFLWASAIRARAAAERVRCLLALDGGVSILLWAGIPSSTARSSAICSSSRRFWVSKPSIAAVMISEVSVGI